MTTLTTASTAATTASTGGASAVPVPVKPTHAAPVPLPFPAERRHEPAAEPKAKAPDLHLLGTGAAASAAGGLGVPSGRGTVAIPLDQFAKQSGPDAAVQTASGMLNVHAVFQLDAKTRQLQVAIVDEDGQLVRMIPPESVGRMIAAMAQYRGR